MLKRVDTTLAGGSLLLAALVLAGVSESQQPDLRSRIDALVAEARSVPTNAENGRERAEIVDDWASYLSLQGVVIPQLLSTNVATFKLGMFPMPIDPHQTMDWSIEELHLKERFGPGLGSIQVRSDTGRFITFNGYEWTAFWRIGGHHNVFFRGDQGRPAGLRTGATSPHFSPAGGKPTC